MVLRYSHFIHFYVPGVIVVRQQAIRQEYIDYIARNGGDGLEEVRNHHGNDNDGGLVRGDGFWVRIRT